MKASGHTVYALSFVSKPDAFFWVGVTNDPGVRFLQHQRRWQRTLRMMVLQSGIGSVEERKTAELWWDRLLRNLGHVLINQQGHAPFVGRRSPEWRAAISRSRLGYHHTLAAREKMSLAKRGRPGTRRGAKATPETLVRMSVAQKGKVRSTKTRGKIAAGMKRVWANRHQTRTPEEV